MSWHSKHRYVSGCLAMALVAFFGGSLAMLSWSHLVGGLGLFMLFSWYHKRYGEIRELRVQTTLMPADLAQLQRTWEHIVADQGQTLPIMPVSKVFSRRYHVPAPAAECHKVDVMLREAMPRQEGPRL